MIQQILGENVLALRKASGLSKGLFALQAGLSRQWLRKVERGEANMRLDTLDILAKNIGVEAWQLIKKNDEDADAVAGPVTTDIKVRRSSTHIIP